MTVYTGSGFDGLKGKRAMGERAAERDRPTVVLHIGDRNQKGEDIYFAAGEDAVAWCGDGDVLPLDFDLDDLDQLQVPEHELTCVRLGVTTAQAIAEGILEQDGTCEATAVPVPVMDRWLTDAIEALRIPARWEQVQDEQREENERLPELVRRRLDGEGRS
jgi:hypothetical protein